MPRVGSTHRCSRCWLRPDLCFCGEIPRIDAGTRLVIVMHRRETFTASNTGRLAALCLPGTEIRIRGLPHQAVSGQGLIEEGRRPLFLFPSPEAVELNAEFMRENPGPYSLIVPDGSWRQASKMAKREAALHGIAHVKLPPGPESEYRLRRESDPRNVCTIEAIARALGILEGREIQERLERVFRTMVRRTLIARGKLGMEALAGRDATAGSAPGSF